ncbi:MAG: hypothetical protein BZ138_04460 [Methanosphaera sp. rholeuAM270]|nr:MAG: hypothetical protein BZ138_04460 [Methanosphaera sp. rholeuAM270]
MLHKRIHLFIFALLVLVVATGFVSAANDNTTTGGCEVEETQAETSNEITSADTVIDESKSITKKTGSGDAELKGASSTDNTLDLNVTVRNVSIDLVTDSGNEVAITRNITTVNGRPDVKKLGVDYAYADEEGVYTILGSEIRRVMKLDSYCQQIYGFTPKYTFFRAVGSNTKYVISRQKWNVIARSLNSYHVNQGYNAVNTPYALTVNLSGQSRHYCVYYDAQEWINGEQYTCGPTAMSMISQALNCFASERKLALTYATTSRDGTDENLIIKYSPLVHMKLTNINNTASAVKTALNSGKMIFWHIRGHYMCVIGYNKDNNRFLCLNPSGPSHNIAAVQWATWTEMMNTDRPLKEHGFMAVTPYWNLTGIDKTHAKYYYYNMGGKYTVQPNSEYCNNKIGTVMKVTVDQPSNIPTKTNKTVLIVKSGINNFNSIQKGSISFYLNNKSIGSSAIRDGVAGMNYTLPAYAPNALTLTACYSQGNNGQYSVLVSFKRYPSGKSYYNYTKFKGKDSLELDDITAKKADNITFTAYVFDRNNNPVNTGKVVFKLNGKTFKQGNDAIKVKVVNGIAKLNYTVPAYSAKKYILTAVYANDTTRLESNAILTIQKLETKIVDAKIVEYPNGHYLLAKVVDKYGCDVERDTKVSVKINGKTVVNKVKLSGGSLNILLDLSVYRNGVHNVTILAGENGVYKFSSQNITFSKTGDSYALEPTSIVDLKTQQFSDKLNIVARIVDSGNNPVGVDVKLSVKLNSRTILNKAKVSNGLINVTVDVSSFDAGNYRLMLVAGSAGIYQSTTLERNVSIS